jgi:hypothetical protein
MAILWQDGFDLYNNQTDISMAYVSVAGAVATTGGRFGAGAWQANNYGITRAISGITELWTGFAVNTSSTSNQDKAVLQFGSTVGVEGLVTYNPATGAWKVWNGSENTLLGTATQMLAAGWHWVDAHFKLSATVGVMEVWIDNVQLINVTGANTIHNSGVTQVTTVQIGDNGGGGGLNAYIDDWIINDLSGSINNGRVGDSRIETLVPTSDAGTNNATPSTGTSHYAVVDEPQFDVTDYLTMPNTSGDKEVFGHGALVSTPAIVHAVSIKMVSQKSDAGAYSLEPLVVSNTTEGDGSSQALTTSWGIQSSVFEADPHTSAAWTYANVNSASIGYKVP